MTVDLSGSLRRRIDTILAEAREALEGGDAKKAARKYREAATLFESLRKYTVSPAGRKDYENRARRLRERAESLESASKRPARPEADFAADKPAQGQMRTERERDDEALRSHILSLIRTSTVTWDQIGGLEETKRRIQTALSLTLARTPRGVKIPRSRMILLQGPPGTGKTLLAAAVAGQLRATFFDVKASQVLSRYFGDSPRLISLLFDEARRRSPSVVFIDEFEALAASRTGDESGPERRILATLLAELDGLAGKDEEARLLTLAATNVPHLLDPAILSRFSARIEVPLPDTEARREILRIHIEKAGFRTSFPLDALVPRTQGFSGRDISRLCGAAVENMLVRANPELLQAARGTPGSGTSILEEELSIEPLSEEDFEVAFRVVEPGGRGAP